MSSFYPRLLPRSVPEHSILTLPYPPISPTNYILYYTAPPHSTFATPPPPPKQPLPPPPFFTLSPLHTKQWTHPTNLPNRRYTCTLYALELAGRMRAKRR
ncbi:predicted protein [Plenodomus lingam JN3]|uniref:Predicted protein n=2 Tax=Leptosphaeria maculans TaxID=5022 RepID=E4ZMT9_LEPMJ|nr:predicted protein [Plenodomus lingam JN3]CBX92542.1 predicted protein [Plenodomus lingam JN3]